MTVHDEGGASASTTAMPPETARAFPDRSVRDVAFLGAGMHRHADLIDGEWVFCFPKREAVTAPAWPHP